MPADAPVARVLALLDEVAASQCAELIDGPAGDWEHDDGQLRNRRADFFRVIGRGGEDPAEEVLIRQPETALVGLIVSGDPGHRRFLLSARAEPGLIGGCQLSATIQSTPSNYERRHGGGATPHLEALVDPGADVLHDSMQYDWAQYYHDKVKRFRIVRVGEEAQAVAPMIWVDEPTVRTLLMRDQTMTCDLRVALALLDAGDRVTAPGPALPPAGETAMASRSRDLPLEELRDWTIETSGLRTHSRDREIVWVRTRSATREVPEWDQPLMKIATAERIVLGLRGHGDRVEVALRPETRAGLDGRRLWFPAPVAGGVEAAALQICAEGGRFWRHAVEVTVVRGASGAPGTRWFSLEEVERACLGDRVTSVELRLAAGLARCGIAEGGEGR